MSSLRPWPRVAKSGAHIMVLGLTIGLFLAPFSSASLAAVFGPDGRVPLSDTDTDAKQFVGRLQSQSTRASCTAVCLSDTIIATAGHCLFPPNSVAAQTIDLSQITFAPMAAANGEAAYIAGRENNAQRDNVIVGTEHLSLAPPIGAAKDWAVIRLDRPICRAGGLPLASAPEAMRAAPSAAASDTPLAQISLHQDLDAETLYRAAPCQVLDMSTDAKLARVTADFTTARALVFHDCDTGAGSSGSPLLQRGSDGLSIFALNVGTYYTTRMTQSAASNAAAIEVNEAIANTAIMARVLAAPLSILRQREREDAAAWSRIETGSVKSTH